MAKFMDGVYKHFSWIIIVLSMIAYFAYQVLDFDGEIQKTITDWRTYIHVLFVTYLNVMMVSSAYDGGTSSGINSTEYNLADKLNNQIITSVNNEMDGFRTYVKTLNEHELQTLRDDFLFKVGDKKVEELTKKEKRKYNKLKPIRHDIYGFNLPLYYEMSKNGQVKYQSSVKRNQGKRSKQIKKVFNGILFAGMTVNVVFSMGNVGVAFISLMIISTGLILTYVLTFFPQAFKFKNDLPKKVILKKTLYDSYVAFKTGTHVLKKLEVEHEERAVTKTEQPIINDKKDNALTHDPSPIFDTVQGLSKPANPNPLD